MDRRGWLKWALGAAGACLIGGVSIRSEIPFYVHRRTLRYGVDRSNDDGDHFVNQGSVEFSRSPETPAEWKLVGETIQPLTLLEGCMRKESHYWIAPLYDKVTWDCRDVRVFKEKAWTRTGVDG